MVEGAQLIPFAENTFSGSVEVLGTLHNIKDGTCRGVPKQQGRPQSDLELLY